MPMPTRTTPPAPQGQTLTRTIVLARYSGLVWLALCALALAPAARAADVDPFKLFQPAWSNGQLVAAGVVVTDPPYRADNTGRTDASAAIQQALTELWAHGGGTAYLPAGRYRIEHSIAVPHSITLCGEWRKPEPGRPLSGTVLLAYADRGNPDGPALLASPPLGHANVFDLTIYYPEQNPTEPVPYPFSIEGKVAYIHDITLVNSYQGILMKDFSGGSVAGIYGTCLKRGVVLKSSCELCSCYQFRLHSDYWTRLPEAAMSPATAARVRAFVARELVGVQVGKSDGLSFYDADLAEAHTPVVVKLEDDETKVMVAPRSNYGFGGGMGQVSGRRTEIEGSWYFGTHFFDLDNYPELARRRYSFAPLRQAAKVGPGTVYQASDFGVVADGATDGSAALRRALDKAGAAGGGTVLLPHGRVRLGSAIVVPAGVELRGGYLGTPVRAWFNTVSTLIIDCGADTSDPERAPAAISLSRNAGLRGVDVCHAKNLWEVDAAGQLVVHPYPYAVRGLGAGVWVRDVILPNAYLGIDLGQARCDRAQVVGLWGTSFTVGVRVGAGSDGVQLENLNFDIGPLGSDYRLITQFPQANGEVKRSLHQRWLDEHAVSYVFGDCTNLVTFDLAGFAPHRFMEFVDQGQGGCRDAQFWSSIFDVPKVETTRFRAGGRISFYGLFVTGGNDEKSLWPEFDDSFHGQVDVYGLCQQQRFNNRPYPVGPDRLRIHLERSLTSGQPVTASSAMLGGVPALALDDDPRTMWQSAESDCPHWLSVKLAEPTIVTRWRVHNAGNFAPHTQNTAAATLQGSLDGTAWFALGAFENNTEDWVDLAVTSDRPVRFVRLEVKRAQQPGTGSNRARIAGFDVFGHAAK